MDFGEGFVSKEHREQLNSASESANPAASSPLELTSPSSPRSPKSPRAKLSPSRGSIKHFSHSNSGRDGRPKKGGSGGKGILGGFLDSDNELCCDPEDPNYESTEENCHLSSSRSSADFEEFKKKGRVIVEEYFTTDDIMSSANELRDLGRPSYHYYFVKKLVSMSMDMHDKEKEMAAVLLSTLYAEVIDPPQVYKGFCKLVESTDDLSVDIPNAVDVLAIFIARAVVDEILPPAFLTKQLAILPKESKGIQVIKRADKGYLSAPLHAENVLRKWGGSKNTTVEDFKNRISDLLKEYIASGDKAEACRCIKDLKVPFFHHDIVKRALMLAMERRSAEDLILDLLKVAHEEGVINASQISKGFNRLIDSVDDLSLDIPSARNLLQSLISKAASEGWLCASSLRSLELQNEKHMEDDTATRDFKVRATSVIKEYFLTGDILEVISSLESEEQSSVAAQPLNAVFVKKLITLSMERKNREKEMASVLLSSLCLPAEHVVLGFRLLIESVEDTALDIPGIVEDLGMFLARAVVDEVIAPSYLDEIESTTCQGPESMGAKVLKLSRSMLRARLSGERILRCWGGGGASKTRWDIDDVKDKIKKLLEEYESGGDVREACRCIKDLGMPFFHHEVVKKALVSIMEKKNKQLWALLHECYSMGLITPNQMMKGFGRVEDCLEDLVLDVPDAEEQFSIYVERAKMEGWLIPSFPVGKTGLAVESKLW